MEGRIIQVGGLGINVYESSGTGAPVILIHGNSASGRTFKHQLQGDLGEQYHLVALDLPGHGASDRASDPANTYNLPGYAKVVAELAHQLGIEEAVLIGWSLGGHIVLEAVDMLPQAKGYVIFGTPPIGIPPAMEQAFLPNPAMGAAFASELSQVEIAAFGEASLKPGATVSAEFFEDVARTDGKARESLAASIGATNYKDEVAIVANLTRPIAVLHGELEQLVNEPYISNLTMPTLWRGAVQIIKDAGHTPQEEQTGQFNALLAAFLADVTS